MKLRRRIYFPLLDEEFCEGDTFEHNMLSNIMTPFKKKYTGSSLVQPQKKKKDTITMNNSKC